MGLDGVEIVMEVEEHFGVTIADEEASEVRTVGDLVRLLEGRVARRETKGCLSLPWFLKLRSAAREAVGDQQLRVRPTQAIADALKPRQRRVLWRSLKKLLGTAPRNLNRPAVANAAIILCVITAGVALLLSYVLDTKSTMRFCLGGTSLAVIMHLVTLPLRTIPPSGWQTFGDVTRRLVGREAIISGFPLYSTSLLLEEVREIVVEQLGVDPDEVTMEARFIEDLGLD